MRRRLFFIRAVLPQPRGALRGRATRVTKKTPPRDPWRRLFLEYPLRPDGGRGRQNLTRMSPPKVHWDDLVPTSKGEVLLIEES
jgi:hypothetical protein